MATTADLLQIYEQLLSQDRQARDRVYAQWMANVQFGQPSQWVRWDDIGVPDSPGPFVPDYLKLPEGF